MGFKTGSISATKFVVGSGYTTIQAAITAANTAGGGIVQIPMGAYTENLSLPDGVSLQGLGTAINRALGTGAGVRITGHHTFSGTGAIGSVQDIAFVNDAAGPTLAVSGAIGSYTIQDCYFLMDAGSGATHYPLSVTATAGRVKVQGSFLYDISPAFAANTTLTHLVHVVPASGSCSVDFEGCTLSRTAFSPPLRAVVADAGAYLTVTRSQIDGWLLVSNDANFTGLDSQLNVPFTGAATIPYPVFATTHKAGKVRLSNCSVLPYGASWITGPADVVLNTPVMSGEGQTNSNRPPYSQVFPTGLDIVGISKANPAVVTTNTAHGLSAGDTILILGNRNPAVNRTHKVVTSLSGNTFSIDSGTLDTGSFAPQAITSSSVAGTTGTINLANTAGLVAGQVVLITTHSIPEFNGVHVILAVVDATSITIAVPATTENLGGATGHVSRNAIGTPTVFGTSNGTIGGVVVKEAAGIMRPIQASLNGTFETYDAHGFAVGDLILIADHDDITAGADPARIITAVGDATHFTLTVNLLGGTNKGVAVRVTKPRNRTRPIHGSIILTQVDDSTGSYDYNQFPAGTLYLDKTEPGVLPDIRGMIAPGVSRSLGNKVSITQDVTSGLVPVTWKDEVIVAYNVAANVTYLLPVTQEEGAYEGRLITIIALSDPTVFSVSVQTADGTLRRSGTGDLSGGLAILSLAAHRSVTLVCLSANKLADIANHIANSGSVWAIVSRGA